MIKGTLDATLFYTTVDLRQQMPEQAPVIREQSKHLSEPDSSTGSVPGVMATDVLANVCCFRIVSHLLNVIG